MAPTKLFLFVAKPNVRTLYFLILKLMKYKVAVQIVELHTQHIYYFLVPVYCSILY